MLALLLRTCRWADQYSEEQINSLYFDTSDLDQYERSSTGEFAKDKVRIRWYGSEHDPHEDPLYSRVAIGPGRPTGSGEAPVEHKATALTRTTRPGEVAVPVWLELKSRRGAVSTKLRTVVDVQDAALAPGCLAAGIVPATTLLRTVADFGFFPEGRLCSIVAVSYWRRRFVEPRTGVRVSLDSRIRSTMVMPGVGRGERGLELPGAVVEVKGPTLDLPLCLRSLAEIGSSWTRYSKYSSSVDAHMSTMGAVSRLWPSGAMET